MTEAPGTLAAALVAFQAELPKIAKDEQGQYGKYLSLHALNALVLPLLARVGLYWTCQPYLLDGQFMLRWTLGHVSGEKLDGLYPLPANTPQTIGGAITYARRYALCAVTGVVADEDDDAQAAEAEARKPKTRSEEREARGLMTSAQSRAHDKLVTATKAQPKLADRERGTADETTDWTTGTPEEAPGSVTDSQLRRIHTLFTQLGITNRDERLEECAKIVGPVESSKDLSMEDASLVIAALSDRIAKAAP